MNNIKTISTNIFDTKLQTIIVPVNLQGVMGKGLALQVKQLYPQVYNKYKEVCYNKNIDIGKPYLCKINDLQYWFLLFPTKIFWRNPSKIEYIESGLNYLVSNYNEWGINSIATPLLGCGCGGLNEKSVMLLMKYYLQKIHIPVEIYTKFNINHKEIK